MFLYVFWTLLLHFILCEFPPMVQLTTTQVTELCKKGRRDEQVLYRLGICYYHPSNEYMWQDAIQVCESRNTHLLHLETVEEQDFIIHNAGGMNYPVEKWLGLKKSSENNWVWFYNDKLYPVLSPRWSTSQPHSPRPHDVAQSFRKETWGKVHKDMRLEVVCEDPLPPELTNLFCVNQPTAVSKWGPLSNFHCYYYIGLKSYIQGKTECEMESTHLIFLETLVEETWMDNELREQEIPQNYWLGIEKNDTDHWNWDYRKSSQYEPNPRFKSYSSQLTHAIFNNDKGDRDSERNWEYQTVDRMENVICEEDIYPKLMSKLLCYRQAGEVTGIFNPSNNHCYYVYIEQVGFSVAKRACERRGGYLATFDDTEEQLFVENEAYNYIPSYSFWLGLKRDEYDDWYWLGRDDTKTPMVDERWVTYTDPDSGGHNRAVTVEDGKWIQARRTDTFPFICEEEYDNEFVIQYRVCTKFLRDAIPVFNYETRSCYYLFDNSTDWKTARETCGHSQTYVVHPDTEKEQVWLISLVTDFGVHDSIWIGIESRASYQWSWRFANHAEVTKNTRFPDGTSGGGDNARMLSDGTWERVNRDSLNGLICEDSISPLGIQEAERVNVGSIEYVTQNILEDEETTTSDISEDLTTTEETSEDLSTTIGADRSVSTTEIAESIDSTTEDTSENIAGPETASRGSENPVPELETSSLLTEPSSSPYSFDLHPFSSKSAISTTAVSPTTSLDASSSTDDKSSSEIDPDVLEPPSDLHGSSEFPTYSLQTISSTSGALETMQPSPRTSSTVGMPMETPDGGGSGKFCPNAGQYSGGYVIETPYKKSVVGHYKNIFKIAVFPGSSTLRCAKHCSLNPDCWFFTRDKLKTCTLYQFFYGSLDSLDCAEGVPCYIKACELNGGS